MKKTITLACLMAMTLGVQAQEGGNYTRHVESDKEQLQTYCFR